NVLAGRRHAGQTLDERYDGTRGVLLEGPLEVRHRHAGDLREQLELLAAAGHRVSNGNHHAGDRRTAGLGLDADAGEGSCEAEDLRLRQTDLLTGTGDAEGHFDDLRFGGGQVV